MGKKIKLRKAFTAGYIVALVVVIIGIFLAATLNDVAVRLIGLSIAIIGAFALFLKISQLFSDIVDTLPSEATENIRTMPKPVINIIKPAKAETLAIDNKKAEIRQPESQSKPTTLPIDDDGFVIVPKKDEDILPFDSSSDKAEYQIHDETNENMFNKGQPVESSVSDSIHETPSMDKDRSANQVVADMPQAETVQVNGSGTDDLAYQLHVEDADKNLKITQAAKIAAGLPYKQKQLSVPLSYLVEGLPKTDYEPKKEFEYFLLKLLTLAHSMLKAHTTTYFLVNFESSELLLETYITVKPESILGKARFEIAGDLPSQIVLSGKPELLTEINPSAQLDLLPYYSEPCGISSFIGIPVIFDESIVGVLCADSLEKDAFDKESLESIVELSKFISQLIKNYTEKFELLQVSRTLEAIDDLRQTSSNATMRLSDISNSVVVSVGRIFDFATIGICGYDEMQGGWQIKSLRSASQAYKKLEGTIISLANTLLGECIINNKTVFYSPQKSGQVRIVPNEEASDENAFIAVPMKSAGGIPYGAIFVEVSQPLGVTDYDIKILETMGEYAGSFYEKMHYMQLFQTNSMTDSMTGLLNPTAFFIRLEEEYARSKDFKKPFTLCFFNIDKYASFDPASYQERMEKVLFHVLDIVKSHVRYYDVFGHVDNMTFGLVLTEMDLKSAQLWAEHVRNEIASSVLEINFRRFSVTVSFGLAQSVGTESVDALAENARSALDTSLEKTNCVTLYT